MTRWLYPIGWFLFSIGTFVTDGDTQVIAFVCMWATIILMKIEEVHK